MLLAAALLAAGLAVSVACAAALRHPSTQDVSAVADQWPGTTLQDLQRGRSLYVRRCSGCHTLVLPGAHSTAEWPAYVDAMAEKARLQSEERDDIARFLVAMAAQSDAAQ
jgi:cytochrome c5